MFDRKTRIKRTLVTEIQTNGRTLPDEEVTQKAEQAFEEWIIKGGLADRPHNFTLLLGLLSPFLALVALGFSYYSLDTSKRALNIGQRAYLSVTKSSMAVEYVNIGDDGDLKLYRGESVQRQQPR